MEELCLIFVKCLIFAKKISIDQVVEKIVELGIPSLVLLGAMGREPFFQSRLLNRFAALTGPLGTFAGFAVQAIYGFGYDVLFNKVLETLQKQGKTEEEILAEIEDYPIPDWLKLRVRSYIENVDFEETIAPVDLSDRRQEILSIIQESIEEDFENLESNINEKIDHLERQLNDRIDRSEASLKRFIGIVVAAGSVGTSAIVAVLLFIF